MRHLATICALSFILVAAHVVKAADDGVNESTKTAENIAPSTDLSTPFGKDAKPVQPIRTQFSAYLKLCRPHLLL